MLVEVALPIRLPGTLSYEFQGDLQASRGSRVLVPLGKKELIGLLLDKSDSPPPRGLKRIREVIDPTPLLTPHQLKFLSWAAAYYLTPIGEVLRHLVPKPYFETRSPVPRPPKDLRGPPSENASARVTLTREQDRVVQAILGEKSPFLIKGITGSGKTEIYRELARRALLRGDQVLVLVPEISLTPQLFDRFKNGVSDQSVPYHSGLTESQRTYVWAGIREGRIPLVVGTRSAIFLPFSRLGLIVVDEEHDSSYKQEERFCYSARDLGLWLAKETGATAVLGSATPSLESLSRCRLGRMTILTLSERATGASLPSITVIDRRAKKVKGSFLSEELKEELAHNLKRGEQSLLFLNRRGFSPIVICRSCGFLPTCPDCDISLTYHKQRGVLLCHYCDRVEPFKTPCPRCREGELAPEGAGTERIEEELKGFFPRARIARLDRDTSRGAKLMETLDQIKKRQIDILIGTQMVSKGHDFPDITLVGVINADTSLNLPDFRAAERTYQLLTQVSGRSGRGEKPGRVLIQTYLPEHPGLMAAQERNGEIFIESELIHRKKTRYPPYARLIRLVLSGLKSQAVENGARAVARRFETFRVGDKAVEVLGPAPCPIPRIRSRSRWHLLIKSERPLSLDPALRPLLDDLSRNTLPSGVRMLVDVDPLHMM